MGTIALVLVAVIITVIVMRMIQKQKEKKISVVVMSTDSGQVWKMFAEQVATKVPNEYLKVNYRPTDTEFVFTLKK